MSQTEPDRRATWRDDLDALQFGVPGEGSLCLVHRLAFRALLPSAPAEGLSRQACLEFFFRESRHFEAAAKSKVTRLGLAPGHNLHLNSRDIRRAIAGDVSDGLPKACRVLTG
ncbi:hypothetical protein J2858_000478 [Neorhizobium galegae]|uniref:hypothetical protein n=1 Tax=Neorhizobium galegae TaxID=399 RepID=UPI001AE7CD56|nr:hypothetical protein [Neorhizobium galegae]